MSPNERMVGRLIDTMIQKRPNVNHLRITRARIKEMLLEHADNHSGTISTATLTLYLNKIKNRYK